MTDIQTLEQAMTPRTVGQTLREAREARGLTLRDIAGITKIQVATLECLENDRFDEIHAEVFVRGFLRAFAREVRVDADAIVASYLEQQGISSAPRTEVPAPAIAAPVARTPVPALAEAGNFGRIAYGVSVAVLVLGLALSVLMFTGERTSNASAAFQDASNADTWRPAPQTQSEWRTN